MDRTQCEAEPWLLWNLPNPHYPPMAVSMLEDDDGVWVGAGVAVADGAGRMVVGNVAPEHAVRLTSMDSGKNT